MVNINISIKREAYEFLKSFKTRDKSFSDVILGFRENGRDRSGKSLLRFAGAWKHLKEDEIKEMEKRINSVRRKSTMDLLKNLEKNDLS